MWITSLHSVSGPIFAIEVPINVQGLVVGRLADSDTGLAAKVKELDQDEVEDLLERLHWRRRRVRV
jgi:hypothetical protein